MGGNIYRRGNLGGNSNCVEGSYFLETCSAGGNWQRDISFGGNLEAIAEAIHI
jgi:hypothetical protein